MRVLLTTDTIGGVWTYTQELTAGLLERSHHVSLVSFGQAPSADQEAWAADLTRRFPVLFTYTPTSIPLEWMEQNATAYTDAEPLLLQQLETFRPDLFHTNQFCFGRLPTSIPRLVVAHSDVLSWAVACRPHGLEASPWLHQYRQLVQEGLAAATAVVAPTQWMLSTLAVHFTLPAYTGVIPNGRDLPTPVDPPHRQLQAVTIGRLWDDAKGIATLEHVTSPIPIYVAGDTQHGLQSAPATLGSAHPLGRLSEDALLHLLRSSSIYLALSLYEPFGLAPLEAALCGCAILARDIPSFREVWGDTALYFHDPASLSRQLSCLAGDPQLLQQFQRRALRQALPLSRRRMTGLYLDLYTSLLSPSSPANMPPKEVHSLAS